MVVAAILRSLDQAEEVRQLLADHDVPALTATEDKLESLEDLVDGPVPSGGADGTAVLVPADVLDEASEIIAEREEFENLATDDDALDDDEDDDDDSEDMIDLGNDLSEGWSDDGAEDGFIEDNDDLDADVDDEPDDRC